MKVEVEFAQAYDSQEILPIKLGRLLIGPHIARYYFDQNGKTKLFVSKKAIDDGSLVLLSSMPLGMVREDDDPLATTTAAARQNT